MNKQSHRHKSHKRNKTYKHKHRESPFPIDVVYTWNGENTTTTHDIRTNFNYELKYSLRSVYKYAPWVHKIYILMNPPKKTPSWIKENNDKIVIIDHLDTFPSKKYLPTTNSNSIETTLSRIPGLCEHFIYFNDDIFLGRYSNYTDFFTPEGKSCVDHNTIQTQSTYINNQNINKLSILFPPNNALMYKHIPIPKHKSMCDEFNIKYAEYVHWIRKIKKRKGKGFSTCEKNNLRCPCQQIHYPVAKYTLLHGNAVLTNNEYRMYYTNNTILDDNETNLRESLNNIKQLKPLFFCINDTETNPEKRNNILKITHDFFEEYYPDKPNFEK